jgi:hypothetical protein
MLIMISMSYYFVSWVKSNWSQKYVLSNIIHIWQTNWIIFGSRPHIAMSRKFSLRRIICRTSISYLYIFAHLTNIKICGAVANFISESLKSWNRFSNSIPSIPVFSESQFNRRFDWRNLNDLQVSKYIIFLFYICVFQIRSFILKAFVLIWCY